MASDELTPAERTRRFVEMFGVSESELIAQGVDIDQYVRDNAKHWQDRTYKASADKLARGESLLPYQATSPYIANGVTMFARNWDGSVTVDRSIVRLLAFDDTVLAQALPSQVRVSSVPVWFGLGVRLQMADGARWYVQPRGWPSNNIPEGRSANRVLRAALSEAGAQVGRPNG